MIVHTEMTSIGQLTSISGLIPLRTPAAHATFRVKEWQLGQLIAEGGLARVYRARPADSSPDVPPAYALKMLRPRWHDDPRAVHLLRREALVGRTVSNPHVVSVLAASVAQPPYYVVMPWLSGTTLQSRLAGSQGIALHEALWIARQVATGLEALARAGWMHGDVKPENVFLSLEGHATLLDLGFARRADETCHLFDRCVMGTWSYLAPERITSAAGGDIRSDLYSLGAMLYEMLSGRLPFLATDLGELAQQHKRQPPPPLDRLMPCLPMDVVQLVRRLLAKDPLRRPQTPAELIELLVPLEVEAFFAWAVDGGQLTVDG
jgi:eukaryotic-like serine/threonine-protein kinase